MSVSRISIVFDYLALKRGHLLYILTVEYILERILEALLALE